MSDLARIILNERRRYCAEAGGGVSLPVAGAVYWAAAAIAGVYLEPGDWAFAAAAGSGLIFPLGLLLQGICRSPFMKAKSPLGGSAMAGILAINLLWPVHFAIISVFPEAAPLTLAIGMALHWPIIGWGYASRVCLFHAIVRVIAVTALWYALPELRLVAIPLAVSALYVLAAMGLSWEASRFRGMTTARVALNGRSPGGMSRVEKGQDPWQSTGAR